MFAQNTHTKSSAVRTDTATLRHPPDLPLSETALKPTVPEDLIEHLANNSQN